MRTLYRNLYLFFLSACLLAAFFCSYAKSLHDQRSVQSYLGLGNGAGEYIVLTLYPKSPEENLRLLKASVRNKFPMADHLAGLFFLNLKNYAAARVLFERSARHIPASYHMLGYMDEMGMGSKKNLKSALFNYQKAAKLYNAEALHRLGEFYFSGVHVPKNYEESYRYFYASNYYLKKETWRNNISDLLQEQQKLLISILPEMLGTKRTIQLEKSFLESLPRNKAQ